MGTTTGKQVMSLDQMRQVGKAVAKDAGSGSVQAFFEAKKDVLAAVLPRHMTPDRMLRIAMGAMRTTPKLMQASVESLFGAVVAASQLGLEPNTPQGHIYLLPFDNRKANRTEVQVIIGYKGLVDLARRSGQIVSISARTRCQNDEWRMVLGTEDSIHHIPADGERGPIVGFYAVARLKDGGVQFEYMSVADVNKVKAQSRAAGNGPWVTHFEEMGKKTTVRRLCKMLPMSIELSRAAAMDEMADAGKPQDMASVLEGEWTPAEEADPETGEIIEEAKSETSALFIKTPSGNIEYPTAEAWATAWEKIAASEAPANLKRAREMNGPLMGEYAATHGEAVMRVQAAIEAKIKAEGN